MTTRKMLAVGLVAVAGLLAVTADAQAFGKRKRGGRGGDDCCGGYAPVYYQSAGGCGGCGGCGGGYAMAGTVGGYAVAPDAMPAPGTGTAAVTPAAGTSTQPGAVVPAGTLPQAGTVYPAGGYYQNGRYVYPAGGYYQNGQFVQPAGGYYMNGQYVYPAGYNGTFQSGFTNGLFQGAIGSPTMYYGTPAGNFGNQLGRGIFRR